MRILAVPVLATLLLAMPVALRADGIAGLWDAAAVINGAEIPFRFEISQSGNKAQGFFWDGNRKIGSTSGSFFDNRLELHYDFLNATLYGTFVNGEFQGNYAQPGASPIVLRAVRFVPQPGDTAETQQVAGNWEMRRVAEEGPSGWDTQTWNLYLRQSGAEVSGAILRVDGDSGILAGHWKNDHLILSHFAGERPLLFDGQVNPDGTMTIKLNGTQTYVAVRTSEALAKGMPDPPDPSRYTSVKDPTQPLHFKFPNVDGRIFSEADARFRGKVVILAIGGSWCPNCHDEASFLVELYQTFHTRGLEIIGLSFEEDSELASARPHMLSFIRHNNIPYPMLLAGTPDQVAEKLPQLVNFGAFPTTIYVGRDGLVRSVYAGFAGEATGEEHVRLKSVITGLIEHLLGEDSQH